MNVDRPSTGVVVPYGAFPMMIAAVRTRVSRPVARSCVHRVGLEATVRFTMARRTRRVLTVAFVWRITRLAVVLLVRRRDREKKET